MAKKIVAVTDIRHDGDTYPAGQPLDPAKFSKDVLKELHDNGAVVIVDDKAGDVKAEDLTPEELGQKGAQMQDVSAEAKQATADLVNSAKTAEAKPEAKPEEKATPTKK